MSKLISSEGTIKTNDGREFTKLIGGFGDNKPMFTVWQVADLLNMKTKAIMENLNNNIENFENNLDYKDLKVAIDEIDSEINLRDFYHVNKLNATKQWIIFSQSGLLKMIKISSSKESWKLYEEFIEDYFKTKVELIVAENTIENTINVLMDTQKMLIGSIVLETDTSKRMELMTQLKQIEDQIEEAKITLAKQDTIKQFEDIVTLVDKFTNTNKCYDIGLFSKLLSVPNMGRNKMFRWLREERMLQSDNIPYQNMMDKFKVVYTERNGKMFAKTLVKGEGVKYIIKKLIKDGYIDSMTVDEIMDKLKDMEEAS